MVGISTKLPIEVFDLERVAHHIRREQQLLALGFHLDPEVMPPVTGKRNQAKPGQDLSATFDRHDLLSYQKQTLPIFAETVWGLLIKGFTISGGEIPPFIAAYVYFCIWKGKGLVTANQTSPMIAIEVRNDDVTWLDTLFFEDLRQLRVFDRKAHAGVQENPICTRTYREARHVIREVVWIGVHLLQDRA